jgi:hypothetical protein
MAWGLGVRNPWFRLRYRRNFFYIGRPLTTGLTLFCRELVERKPVAEFVGILGGPLATILGLVAGLAAWRVGVRSDVLVAWIAISALLSATSAIPFSVRRGNIYLQSDARLLIDLAIHGCEARPPPLGVTLTGQHTLIDLVQRVGNRGAADYLRITTAIIEAG